MITSSRIMSADMAIGIRHMAHGAWHLALGTWHLALGTWHLALGTGALGTGALGLMAHGVWRKKCALALISKKKRGIAPYQEKKGANPNQKGRAQKHIKEAGRKKHTKKERAPTHNIKKKNNPDKRILITNPYHTSQAPMPMRQSRAWAGQTNFKLTPTRPQAQPRPNP